MKNPEALNRLPLTAGSVYPKVQLTLDRITVVGSFASHGLVRVGEEWTCPVLDRSQDITRRHQAKYPYRYQFATVSGVTIQLAEKKAPVPPVRIDYNPDDANQCELAELLLQVMDHKRVTRLDWALDYQQDFSSYMFTTATSTKTCTFESGRGVRETLYLGASGASQRYRIYDKALEAGLQGTLWRIEEQQRFKPSESWQLHLPFSNLVSFQSYPTLPIMDKMALETLHRTPAYWGELSRKYRDRFRKIMKDAPRSARLDPDPQEVYFEQCQPFIDYITLITKGRDLW